MKKIRRCVISILITVLMVPGACAAVFADDAAVQGALPAWGQAETSEGAAVGSGSTFSEFTPEESAGEDGVKTDKQADLTDESAEALRRAGKKTDPGTDTGVCPDGQHTPDEGVVNSSATCSSPGRITYTCTVCGEEWNSEIPLDPKAHKWGKWKTVKPASNLNEGVLRKTCNLCGGTKDKTTPQLKETNVWQKIDGKWYYFGSDAKYFTGWHKLKLRGDSKLDKTWCFFGRNGRFKKSYPLDTRSKWVTISGRKFYFTPQARIAAPGFRMINNKLYYFLKDRSMAKGRFKTDEGRTYRTRSDGSLGGEVYLQYKHRTFILVDISEQKLRYYSNAKLKMNVDVVTGTKGSHDTPRGTFRIMNKSRGVNLVGPTWNVHVDYWMQFRSGGFGIHDASWRSSAQFSNHRTYLSSGSHGCVNMRPGDAGKLFNKVSVGTMVIVQN